jgi:hypothetical protein
MMAWVRFGTTYINLDTIRNIEFRETDAGLWCEFYNDEGELVLTFKVEDYEAEKLIQALDYATKALPIYMSAFKFETVKKV